MAVFRRKSNSVVAVIWQPKVISAALSIPGHPTMDRNNLDFYNTWVAFVRLLEDIFLLCGRNDKPISHQKHMPQILIEIQIPTFWSQEVDLPTQILTGVEVTVELNVTEFRNG
ncbi:hypothetical protein GE061_007961 [Apolygus lucorum]|uniref:Uncharacterized protein n=1 Tax=Apolygus lucorum TaxID=248454 RepID=A0A8S9WPR8_APOLU|nr:hypothetical protein GE061_007961 [Apolygus lucorum]